MSSIVQKNELDESQKMDIQNSQNMMINNNDSNRYSSANNRHSTVCRKTSKRRQAQEEKATVLQLFKQLIKVVNQKFQNAYLSPPKQKLSKPPKMQKNPSVKASRKQENPKPKKEEASSANCPIINRNEERSESQEKNPPIFPSNIPVTQPINIVSSPLAFPSFNSNSHMSSIVRKGSQSHGHRQKSLNEKHQLLKETLKKEIFENYSVQMKYIVHEDFEEEAEEIRQADQNGKMIEESSEQNVLNRVQITERGGLNYDDFELMSHEEKMQEEFIKSMKNIDNNMDLEDKEFNEELERQLQKCQKEQAEQSSSSSSQENQKYPPHSHMPQGHASTTEQFLQQHHPIITTLPHSCQSLTILEHHQSQVQEQKNSALSVQKLPSQHLEKEKNS